VQLTSPILILELRIRNTQDGLFAFIQFSHNNIMKRFVLLSWLLAAFINPDLFSQSKLVNKNNFYDAESLILFEEYKEALPVYQQLSKFYPDNANFKYRIGQCYINIPGEKKKAISYLENAVRNIDPKFKEGDFRETGAPGDALFFLGNAYMINNQLDQALETYRLFRKNLNKQVYDTNIVDLQIQACQNAKELMKKPLFINEKNLGNIINSNNSEFNPVISDNEDLMVFSRSEAFYDAIFYTRYINGQWTPPVNMNGLLKVDRDLYPTSLSKDGKTLYMYYSADFDGNIYTTNLENGTWSPMVKLNDNINTKYWESHATISHDNRKLYFTSNRKGTLGGLDIYVSARDSTGDWGPAVNLGPVINTPYNEESPFLSDDDKTLFFSSRGHFNMGGYDIFYSTLFPNGEWSVPLNVGYPMNTTDDDLFFKPLKKGYEGYYATEIPGGFGKQDIYRLEIFSKDHPRKFYVRGMVKVGDVLSNLKDSVKVSVVNLENPIQIITVYTSPKSGEYEIQLPQGNYQVTYEGEKSEKLVKSLDLPITNPSDNFVLPGIVLPRTDYVADLNVRGIKTISVTSGDSIHFPIGVEANSLLSIERWVGNSLVSLEQFFMKDSTFTYSMAPAVGDNKIVFKLTDRFNNKASSEIHVIRGKPVAKTLTSQGYGRVSTDDQISAFAAMLLNRADDKLKKVIGEADLGHRKFGNVDDLISYLKQEASRKNISPEELNRLALKVAVMDNVLSQAAVDLLAKYTEGDLKKILSGLDIYKENLKTWSDLQAYIQSKTGGKITADDLNKIAGDILGGADQAISVMRNKILAYSNNYISGNILRESVAATDLKNIRSREGWLQAFYNESVKQSLTPRQMADILAALSSAPGASVDQYLGDLAAQSEGSLPSSLKSLDLKKENISSPGDLLSFLLSGKDKVKYPEDALYKAIANLIMIKETLAGVDLSILRLKEKILVYSEKSDAGNILRQSVANTDRKNIRSTEKWLQSFYGESINLGLSHRKMTDMLSAISSMPGTRVEQYLLELAGQSGEPLLSSLKSLDLKEEKITSPGDLLRYLITNKDKGKYPEEAVYRAIANLILSKDIPAETIISQSTAGQWYLKGISWMILLGAGLCFIFFFFIFRKRKKNKEK
jgi:hypothetical protein